MIVFNNYRLNLFINIHIIEYIAATRETINTEDDSCMSGLVRAMI